MLNRFITRAGNRLRFRNQLSLTSNWLKLVEVHVIKSIIGGNSSHLMMKQASCHINIAHYFLSNACFFAIRYYRTSIRKPFNIDLLINHPSPINYNIWYNQVHVYWYSDYLYPATNKGFHKQRLYMYIHHDLRKMFITSVLNHQPSFYLHHFHILTILTVLFCVSIH